MKKLTSIILAIAIISSTLIFGIDKPLIAEAAEEEAIQSFINETVELIRENDIDKDFIVDYEDDISTFSTHSTELENHNFQTCRLIVQANKEIEKLNSIGIASGFQDFYIVQFANEKDAESAYKTYLERDYVESVSPDRVYNLEMDYATDSLNYITYENGTPNILGFWGSEVTGAYELKDYITANYNVSLLPEIKVGVLDSGVDYEHSFLKDRIIRTGFNSSDGGIEESEYDINFGHGTSTSGTIVDNTPSNVKVANYRVINDEGTTTICYIVSGLLRAIEEECDIINMSFGCPYVTDTEYNAIFSAIQEAYNKGCAIVASAGNDSCDIGYIRRCPGAIEDVITVAASNKYIMPTSWSSIGKNVDIMAPGEEVPTTMPNNKYVLTKGTSYSAPFTAAVAALLMTLYPEETNVEIERRIESSADGCDLDASEDMCGYGVIDVIGAAGLKRVPSIDIIQEEGTYIGKTKISISVPEGCQVYYTTDQTYPSKENGLLYNEPIVIEDDTIIIHAVSYNEKDFRSDYVSEKFRVSTLGTDEMFEINSDGVITSYIGNVKDLTIPDKINGLEVTGLAEGLFSDVNLFGITFPESVKILPKNLFYNNSTIQVASGNGVTEISNSAFYSCTKLYSVDFPNVQKIEDNAFYYSSGLSCIDFPQCKYIGKNAFQSSLIRYAHLPSVEEICYQAFYRCRCLYDLYVPNLSELRHRVYSNGVWFGNSSAFSEAKIYDTVNIEKAETITYGAFYQAQVTRLEFSNAKVIETLPIAYCKRPIYGTITVVLPSTLESCALDEIPYDEEGIPYEFSYKVYGSKGTYAERWAKENKFNFVEITQKTAVISDLPKEYYSYMKSLEADVVGFNRTYQWYGSETPNYNGVAITGATEKKFSPDKFMREYKYYYCVVTSTDVGYDPIEIKTGICENKTYNPYNPPKTNGKVTIATPSTRYLKYGESVNLYANATGLPEGAKIKWRIVEGSGVTLDPSVSGKICTVTSKSNGDVVIEAYAVNKNGNTIVNEKGNRICDREGISSEVSLWWVILHFIKQVFGITKTAVSMIL